MGVVQRSLVGTPEVVNESLGLIIAHSKRDESAKQESFSAHSTKHEPERSATKAASDRGSVLMIDTSRSSGLALSDAADPNDYLGRC